MKLSSDISYENKFIFMWIVCQVDDSHEMSNLVFSENFKNKECRLIQVLLSRLKVKSIWAQFWSN